MNNILPHPIPSLLFISLPNPLVRHIIRYFGIGFSAKNKLHEKGRANFVCSKSVVRLSFLFVFLSSANKHNEGHELCSHKFAKLLSLFIWLFVCLFFAINTKQTFFAKVFQNGEFCLPLKIAGNPFFEVLPAILYSLLSFSDFVK